MVQASWMLTDWRKVGFLNCVEKYFIEKECFSPIYFIFKIWLQNGSLGDRLRYVWAHLLTAAFSWFEWAWPGDFSNKENYIFFFIFSLRFIEFMRFLGVRAKKFWINFSNFAIVRFLGIFQRWRKRIKTFSTIKNSTLDHWQRYWAGDRVIIISCWDQRFVQIDQIWPGGANHGSSGASFWVVQNRA